MEGTEKQKKILRRVKGEKGKSWRGSRIGSGIKVKLGEGRRREKDPRMGGGRER